MAPRKSSTTVEGEEAENKSSEVRTSGDFRFFWLSDSLGMPNPMINPATGRVMNAYTLLRRTGPNANHLRVRVSTATVADPDMIVSGEGIAGPPQLGVSGSTLKAIGSF